MKASASDLKANESSFEDFLIGVDARPRVIRERHQFKTKARAKEDLERIGEQILTPIDVGEVRTSDLDSVDEGDP